ncbi:MAG: LLM class flavin-dependent oxidoreductase, partial [Nocardioidaceae bacterium]
MDYGHELAFGSFLTPDAADPHAVVELGRVTELAGLDLVTIQDHPYQARHVDTWTLLAFIAASTTRVSVAPNVANLPLRPPFVLARSVATLDVLSSGRVELGLGAGAFWDAIVAAGGMRRSPGQAVEALSEAIDVIRAAWLPGGETVRHEGKHYRVKGVRAGPSPAHDVEIWLGAYRPRMLRLTGRKADGWLPSQGYT